MRRGGVQSVRFPFVVGGMHHILSFVFQAEDGIRDLTVTGVQTCALPICVDASATADVAMLEKIVDINSGTMNLAGVVKVKDVLEPQIEALGFTTHWNPMEQLDGRAGDLVAEHPCALGKGKCGK